MKRARSRLFRGPSLRASFTRAELGRVFATVSAFACVLACLFVFTPRVHAQAKVPERTFGVSLGELPRVSYSARDFLDKKVKEKLQSGLPQTLISRIYLYAEHGKEPLALSVMSCRVVYDLWEGVYRIERQTELSDKTLVTKTLDGVVGHCLEVRQLAVGDAERFARERGRNIYFAVLVEMNPLSQDTVQRIRRWLSRPSGNQLEGNAFFGSFVSIFVSRKLGAAEKTLGFRSQRVFVPL